MRIAMTLFGIGRIDAYLCTHENRAREFFVSFLQVKQDVIAVHTNTVRHGPLMTVACDR